MTKSILVTGSLAFDYIMDFPGTFEENILPQKLKTLSVSFLVQNFNKNFGGISGNIAYTLGLLKQPATILASAGKKDFAPYAKHLQKVGINTSSINIVTNEFTANAFIMTDKNNCQITGFYGGAMEKDTTLTLSGQSDFVVISPTTPVAMYNFAKLAKAAHIPYLFDPAQALPRMTAEQLHFVLTGAEIVIGNDYEIALIMKRTGLSKGQILEKAGVLITTLGEKGSLIETKRQRYPIGIAKPTAIADPTGAGDAYIAGFLSGYVKGSALKISGQMGATAASFAIEHYGTQKHSFTVEEFQARYRKAFGEMVE